MCLIEDLEIRYLANRAPNLSYALLTDFTDADGLKREIAETMAYVQGR